MKFSSLVERVGGRGADAWEVHYQGLARLEAGEDIIVLSVGQEEDHCTPTPIVDVAVDSLRRGRHHYTPVNGSLELRQAIAQRHGDTSGQIVDASRCAAFAGAQNALFAVAQVLLEHGDEVILCEPYYTTYPATFSAAGATVVSVPTTVENGFQPDPAAILARINERTRAIVVNSPNNPSGAVYARPQLAAIVAICAQRNIWLISDEVYLSILPPQERLSPAGLPGADAVCVTVSSVSKSHRMTGWRLGWVVGPPALMQPLYNLCLCMLYGLPRFIMDAAVVALNQDTHTADAIRQRLQHHRELLLRQLGNIDGLTVHSALGGMFVLLDVRALPVSSREFAQQLLDRYAVAVLPCDGFGATGEGLIRVSLCVAEERLTTAGQRLADYVRSLTAA